MRKAATIFVCLVLILSFLGISATVFAKKPPKPPGGGGEEPGTEYRITDTETAAAIGAVYENRIVWQDYRNGNPDLYMYDLGEDGIPFTEDDGGESQLTSHPGNDWDPEIWGDKVVFRRKEASPPDFDLFLYDLSTGTEYQITDDLAHVTHDIYENLIVTRNDYKEIWVFDLGDDGIPSDDDQEYAIASQVDNTWPRIHGNKIVYQNNSAINVYYLSGNLEGQTLSMSMDHVPSISDIFENYIVWSDQRNGNSDVFLYDLGPDGELGTSDDGGEEQITRSRGHDDTAKIHGSNIVWRGYRLVKGGWERNENIFLHNLISGDTDQLTNSGDARVCRMHGDHIIYQDDREGKTNVYLYKLNP